MKINQVRADQITTMFYLLIKLRDGAGLSGQLIGHFCGQSFLPPEITTVSRWLYVRFVSDRTVTRNGFRLEYVIDGK